MFRFGYFLLIISIVSATSPKVSSGCNGDPNAESTPCGDPCPTTCENKDNPFAHPCQEECIKNGCKCKAGFILNKEKKCIRIKDCPVYCKGPNEYYSECTSDCPEHCLTTNGERALPCLMSIDCHPGCLCLPGYILNSNRTCIPEDQCPPFECNRPGEEFSKCGDACRKTCANTVGGARLYCMGLCRPSCICKKGLVRNDAENYTECIEPRLCPKKCYGDNMEYQECGVACPKTCANRHLTLNCSKKCAPGCFCKAGHVLDSDGICIIPENCPAVQKCKGKNEQFSECGANKCQTTCENYGKVSACESDCIPGCVCNKLYIRNKDGVCIKPSECYNNVCPGKNEAYSDCVSPCGETCATLGKNITCNFLVCNPGCDCKPGFLRNSKNVCVSPSECESKKCRKNEVWSECGNNGCRNTCIKPTFETVCRGICNPGCVCKKGYLLNSKKECVLPKECDNLTCRQNEELSDCADENCRVTCSNFGETLSCTPNCKPGCVCKWGFIRSIRNLCIKPTQCENNVCPKDNEVYTDCLSPCGETCATLGQDITCNFLVCNPGCDCSEGYFRNSKGDCVLPEDCDSQCGENEVWKECGTCDPSCENLKPTCMYAKICRRGCYCKAGYVRQDGECIPVKDCPANNICTGVNEEYSKCGNNSCQLNCDTYGKNYLCKPICNPGCICKEPFIRDSNGICIHPSECAINCNGENYEYNDCGSACPTTCDILGKKIRCPTVCVKGCFCKKGFVLNAAKECILPEDCPPKNNCTGVNEIYSECDNNSCQLNCDTYGKNYACKPICTPGCVCKKPFIRNADGICIHPKDCEVYEECSGKNYIFKVCGPTTPKTCKTKHQPIETSEECVSGCFCKDGYVLDDDDNCILPEQCPKRKQCKGLNEVYTNCTTSCPQRCPGKDGLPPFPCEPRPFCVAGCQCQPGFVRDENFNCISPKECPPFECRNPNEEYSVETQSCVCIHGFVRDAENKCVGASNFGKVCGVNEEYATCGSCDGSCNNPFPICTTVCRVGCFCTQGYVRENSVCILREKCSSDPIIF